MIRLILLLLLISTSNLQAQHGGGGPDLVTVAPPEATQWNFLVGQWTLDVRPTVNSLAAKIHGAPKFAGTWRAWRALDGFGVEDEMRIIDGSGNPRSFTHAIRVYDSAARKWNASSVDVYRSTITVSTAEWNGREMTALSSKVVDGATQFTRGRYTDITPNSFTFVQERSADGKSWETTLTINAKRTAATAPR